MFHRHKHLLGALGALALLTATSVVSAAPAPPAAPSAPTADDAGEVDDVDDASAPAGEGGVINLNTATVDQLTFLPGIGESKAERIVAFRAKHTFKRAVELARVKGIGLKSVRKLRPWIRVEGPTTLAGPVKVARDPAAATRGKARRGGR